MTWTRTYESADEKVNQNAKVADASQDEVNRTIHTTLYPAAKEERDQNEDKLKITREQLEPLRSDLTDLSGIYRNYKTNPEARQLLNQAHVIQSMPSLSGVRVGQALTIGDRLNEMIDQTTKELDQRVARRAGGPLLSDVPRPTPPTVNYAASYRPNWGAPAFSPQTTAYYPQSNSYDPRCVVPTAASYWPTQWTAPAAPYYAPQPIIYSAPCCPTHQATGPISIPCGIEICPSKRLISARRSS